MGCLRIVTPLKFIQLCFALPWFVEIMKWNNWEMKWNVSRVFLSNFLCTLCFILVQIVLDTWALRSCVYYLRRVHLYTEPVLCRQLQQSAGHQEYTWWTFFSHVISLCSFGLSYRASRKSVSTLFMSIFRLTMRLEYKFYKCPFHADFHNSFFFLGAF